MKWHRLDYQRQMSRAGIGHRANAISKPTSRGEFFGRRTVQSPSPKERPRGTLLDANPVNGLLVRALASTAQYESATWTTALAERVLALRKQYPCWGKDKLVVLLAREKLYVSVSMVGRILSALKRRGALHEPPKVSLIYWTSTDT